ncbi:MAG: hypothetical protein HY903_18350 [Deltaproteobacteria bacterium]|nr:hypothetical protein [Deltaproteobacteria bacterium]
MHALLAALLMTSAEALAQDVPYPKFEGLPTGAQEVVPFVDGVVLLSGETPVVRLRQDGSVDRAFAAQLGFAAFRAGQGRPRIAAQGRDRLLVSGWFDSYGGFDTGCLVALRPNGAIDIPFARAMKGGAGGGRGAACITSALAVQPDGTILVGGNFTTFGGAPARNLARLKPDGSVDAAFSANLPSLEEVREIAVAADGRIAVTGFRRTQSGDYVGVLTRLSSTGAATPKQLPPQKGIGLVAYDTQGNLYVVGDKFYRFKPDDSEDPSFNPEVQGFAAYAIAFQKDGKILLGGRVLDAAGGQSSLIRLLADGKRDPAFKARVGPPGEASEIRALALLPDGGILIGGVFGRFGDQHIARGFLRVEADGTTRMRTITPPSDVEEQQQADRLRAGDLWADNGVTTIDLGGTEGAAHIIASSDAWSFLVAGRTEDGFALMRPGQTGLWTQWFNNGGLARSRGAAGARVFGVVELDGPKFMVAALWEDDRRIAIHELGNRGEGAAARNSTTAFSSDATPTDFAALPDGRLLIGGMDSVPPRPTVARFRGTRLDTSFGRDGVVRLPEGAGEVRVTPLASGKLFVTATNGLVYRLDKSGRADTAFGGTGAVRATLHDELRLLRALPTGADGVMLIGQVQQRLVVTTLTSAGACASSTVVSAPAPGVLQRVVTRDDGRFVAVFSNAVAVHDATGAQRRLTLLPDGVDATSATLLKDGAVIASGSRGGDFALVRVEPDGAIKGHTSRPVATDASALALSCAVTPLPATVWSQPAAHSGGAKETGPALDAAKRALASGDLLAAIDAVQPALATNVADPDLNFLLAALLHDADAARAAELRTASGIKPGPFPTVPSATPPLAS